MRVAGVSPVPPIRKMADMPGFKKVEPSAEELLKTASFDSVSAYKRFISKNQSVQVISTFAFKDEIVLTYRGRIGV